MLPTAHCSLQTPHWHWGIPVTPGDLEGRLGLTTMLTPSSTCHQSGSGPTSMIGARSPTPSPWLSPPTSDQSLHSPVASDVLPWPCSNPSKACRGWQCLYCISNACYFMHRCQMIDCQHQVQPLRTMSKITITATSALILGMTHLITFPLSSSLSHGVVNDHFRYILAILLKQNGLNTGRFWNVFSDSPLLTRSDLKLHTITQINHLYMFSNSNTQQHSQANAFQHWHIDQYWMTGCWSQCNQSLLAVV